MNLLKNSRMNKYKLCLLFVIIIFYCVSFSLIAEESSTPDSSDLQLSIFNEFLKKQDFNIDDYIDKDYLIMSIKSKNDLQIALLKDEYEYKSFIYKHRRNVFNWQLDSSKIIFLLVLIIVGIGIIFSGIQLLVPLFRKQGDKVNTDKRKDESTTANKKESTAKSKEKSVDKNKEKSIAKNIDKKIDGNVGKSKEENKEKPVAENSQNNNSMTSIELSKDKIKIQSSVIGLVILTLSLAFFYLYLTVVYPITEIESSVKTEKVSKVE